MDPPADRVTELLRAWGQGDQAALGHLTPLVYNHLHSLARLYMAQERPGHTLQATALVHEAWLRLFDSSQPSWHDRAHFFALCARLMRRILVDWARSRKRLRRRSESPSLQEVQAIGVPNADLVAVDDALTALAAVDPRKSQVVEMRFFGGLTARETAEVLSVSEETVLRDFRLAKIWLRRELSKRQSAQ